MIVTVGDASPRQARGHIGDSCVKWKHFLSDVSDVADQTGTVRGRIERVEMSLKPGFHMVVIIIVSICRRLIGDTLPMCRSRSPTVTIIWKPGLKILRQNNIDRWGRWKVYCLKRYLVAFFLRNFAKPKFITDYFRRP